MSKTQQDERPLSYQDKYTDVISEMVYPFFNELKITFFSHVRVWHTGLFESLMTETSLPRFYIEQQYPISFSLGNGIFLDSGCYVLSYLPDVSSQQDLDWIRVKYNLDHFIYLVDKQSKWDDLFILATSPENRAYVNLVFNNMDFIKQGLHHYKYSAKKLLEKAPRISYPSHYFVRPAKERPYRLKKDGVGVKKILLPLREQEVSISRQEYKFLSFYIQNYKIKEIAQMMNLSPRTVETYLNSLRNKLHCQNSSDLVKLVNSIYLF